MGKIISFEDFSKKAKKLAEDDFDMAPDSAPSHKEELNHYMFFQNLSSIRHYLDEILSYDKAKVDEMLSNGHDWAVDHISTSKDDIQEVAEWIRNEMDSEETQEAPEPAAVEPENTEIEIQGDDDAVDTNGSEEGDEEEEPEEE